MAPRTLFRSYVLPYFGLKSVGTPVFMTTFFVAYFAILRHPRVPALEMPITALDRWIDFHPVALIPYVSLWVYVSLPSLLMNKLRELLIYTTGATALSAIGLTIFYIWPTQTTSADIDWHNHPSILFLKNADASGNACPSLHTAFAAFTAVWLGRIVIRIGAGSLGHMLNIAWALAIVYSTLATRQHVAIDAAAGVLLGGIVGYYNLRLCPESVNT